MHGKDEASDNEKQQMCAGDANHIGEVPKGSAVKGHKNGHIRGHNKTV